MRRDRGRFVWKSRFPDDALHCTRKICIIGCAARSELWTVRVIAQRKEKSFLFSLFSAQAETY
jgi:hypothetical protein